MAACSISSLFIQSQKINSFDESFLVIQSYNKYNKIFFAFIQKKNEFHLIENQSLTYFWLLTSGDKSTKYE